MRFINYFRKSVPVATPYPGNEDAQQRYYKKLRLQVLIAALLSHSLYYVCRTTLNVVKEPILDNGALNATQLGMIGSAMLFVYAVGKFVNGFLADYSNIKRFMAGGLILSAGRPPIAPPISLSALQDFSMEMDTLGMQSFSSHSSFYGVSTAGLNPWVALRASFPFHAGIRSAPAAPITDFSVPVTTSANFSRSCS